MNRRIVTVLVTVVALLLLVGLSVAFFVLPAARESTPVIPTDTAPDTAATQSATGPADTASSADDAATDATDSADATETTGDQTNEQGTGLQVQQGVVDREDFEEQDPTKPATGDGKPADQKKPVLIPPDQTTPDGTQPALPADPKDMTFAMYEAMSEEEQEKFVESFDSVADFVDWWNQAQKEVDHQDPIKIEDGKIDLGKLP